MGNTCAGFEVILSNSGFRGHGPGTLSWDIKDIFARRHEFVTLAGAGGVSLAALCRRFGISHKTGYK
jgi:hypothetical protein